MVEVGNWFNNLSMHATDNEAHLVSNYSYRNIVFSFRNLLEVPETIFLISQILTCLDF